MTEKIRPMDLRQKVQITVSYDCRDGRSEKIFENEFEARRFYVSKAKEGKHPSLKATNR